MVEILFVTPPEVPVYFCQEGPNHREDVFAIFFKDNKGKTNAFNPETETLPEFGGPVLLNPFE